VVVRLINTEKSALFVKLNIGLRHETGNGENRSLCVLCLLVTVRPKGMK
jgi:hypothetical protein